MRSAVVFSESAPSRVMLSLLVLLILGIAGGGLLFWAHPRAPLLLIGGAFGAAIALILVQHPRAACYLALLLYALPYGLRPPALSLLCDIIVNGALALALASWLLDVTMRHQKLVWSRTCMALGLFISWACVTALWATDLVEARRELVAWVSGLVLVLVLSNQVRSLRALDGLMTVLRIIGWTMIVCGIYAVFQSGFQFGSRLKVFGTNENEFGVALIVMTPGIVWPALRNTGARRQFSLALSIVFLLCALILIALTGSRGSSLALLLVLLMFSFSKPVRPWGMVGLVVSLSLTACAPFLLDTLISRFAEQDGGEFGGRDVLWKAGLQLLGDVPWTGVGIGNGPFALHRYIASLTNSFNYRSDLPAHNPLLEVGIETGILGMCLFGNILLSALKEFIGSRMHADMRDGEIAGYFPLIIGIGVGYFASWIKGGGATGATFFVMLALFTIPAYLAPARRPSTADPLVSFANRR